MKIKPYSYTAAPYGHWGATTRQVTVMVGAPSRAAAARAMNAVGLGVTSAFLGNYGYSSGNTDTQAAAEAKPGVVQWANEGGGKQEWHEATPPPPRVTGFSRKSCF